MDTIDIRYGKVPEGTIDWSILSNLAYKPFVLDGIQVSSIEGVLQAIKTDNVTLQTNIVTLHGYKAKNAGKNLNWRAFRFLHWNGRPMDRDGPEYQEFLDRIYATCWASNAPFKDALQKTIPMKLEHSIGSVDPEYTILTREEFISRLNTLRDM